jgi:hypothetical protein
MQHYVIKFVSDLLSPGPQVSSTNKTDRQDITEIVLKVALNTIKQTSNNIYHHPSRQYLDTDVVFQIY